MQVLQAARSYHENQLRASIIVENSLLFIDFSNDSFKIASLPDGSECPSHSVFSDPDFARILQNSEIKLRPRDVCRDQRMSRFAPVLFSLALVSNATTRMRLRSVGLRQIFQDAPRCQVDAGRPNDVDPTRLQFAVRQFLRANGLFSWNDDPMDCLPRSIALHHYLNRLGVPAEMKIGVRLAPFSSHAWVELDRHPILDAPEDVAEYHHLLTI